MACPDDVSAEAEKEPELVMGDPGPVAGAGGTVRSVGSAWRQLVPDLRGHVTSRAVWYVYAGWPVGAHRRRPGAGRLEAASSQRASPCMAQVYCIPLKVRQML